MYGESKIITWILFFRIFLFLFSWLTPSLTFTAYQYVSVLAVDILVLLVSSVFPQCSSYISLFLSHYLPVYTASLLSNDVSSEDCLWRGKLKDIWYMWNIKDCNSVNSKNLLFTAHETPFQNMLKNELHCERYFFYQYYSNVHPLGFATSSLGMLTLQRPGSFFFFFFFLSRANAQWAHCV